MKTSGPTAFLSGPGEMAAIMRAHDWSATTLGPPSDWPQALRTAVRLMLGSGHPMYLFWGEAGACLYNDAFRPSIGAERHPKSLGRPAFEVWAEIWDVTGPQIAQVMAGRGSTWHEDQLVPFVRDGRREEVYWTYSFGPVDDATAPNGIGGVLVVCTETTRAVRMQQQQVFRLGLEVVLRDLADARAIKAAAAAMLGAHLGIGRCGYAEIDDTGGFATVQDDWTDGAMPHLSGRQILDGFGAAVIAELRAGRTVRIADVHADPRTERVTGTYEAAGDLRAGMTVPLIKEGRFIAAFYVHQTAPRQWTDDDAELLERVAEATWAAVERARAEAALRASEERLHQLNESLEQQVAERTEALLRAQDDLRQSQKLEAMGQLTGGVAHDFNNLLTPILGSLDILQRRASERDRRLLDTVLQAAERARTLVQRLLAFARRQPLLPVAVDLESLIDGMFALLVSTVGPKVELVVEVDPDLPPAQTDPNQLEMVILNLCANARDAMPDGGHLRMSATDQTVGTNDGQDLAPGRYIRFTVADDGQGMDRATLERAIDPFFSTKGTGKGTGLGLSMVHGFAGQLGGALAITSEPGRGTTVDLWLPVSGQSEQ